MEANRLCKLLNINFPIIQAPLNWISGAELVAAVSNAGGLGTLGLNSGAQTVVTDVELTGERLRSQIKRVKSLTKKPFAINIAIGYDEARSYSDVFLKVAVEEKIPVAIVTAGSPAVYTGALKNAGIKVIHAVSTVKHAKKVEDSGADAVICMGYEGGGHKDFNELTTMVLVPMVADAVKIPIVAGGGIADARGLLAALALGADGVYMGTRFMTTPEANAHIRFKKAITNARDACTVTIIEDKMLNRALINQFTQKISEMRFAGLSQSELTRYTKSHSLYRAVVLGDVEESEMACGQVAGLKMNIISAGQIIQDIKNGINPCMEKIQHKLAGVT